MKKVLIFGLLILCVGCSSGGDDRLQSGMSTNNITIKSISPTKAEEGVNTEFTVTVDYELVGFEQGEINIGFNIEELNKFSTVYDQVVSKGIGTITVKTFAIPVDYEPNGSFTVYANISEFPHPSTWTPLDSDFKDIEVTQILGASVFQPLVVNESDLICYTDYGEQCIHY